MNGKIYFHILVLFFFSVALTGCETLRGAQRDAVNTEKNIKKLPAEMAKTDKWLQEHAW